jgi:NACHT domain
VKPTTDHLRAFGVIYPSDVRAEIEDTSEKPLEGSCAWVLKDEAFLRWWERDDTSLLWIHGDAGKGKTMIMMALIAEISRLIGLKPGSGVLSYFFCKSTNSLLNNAVAVLRGLIYHLAIQDTELDDLLRKKYDETGGALFEGQNVFYTLSRILADMSDSSGYSKVYLMIDALDECDADLAELLREISRKTSSRKIKCIVTSRPRIPIIRETLGYLDQPEISLESESEHVSKAVHSFIESKVKWLAQVKRYDDELTISLRAYLSDKADQTFLWVALVCKELVRVDSRKTMEIVQTFPPELGPLYERILTQTLSRDEDDAKICRQILCVVTLALRPLRLEDVMYLGGVISAASAFNPKRSRILIELCGSFLTNRENTVSLIHQSAADFFKTGKGSSIFLSEYGQSSRGIHVLVTILSGAFREKTWHLYAHRTYADRCLAFMSMTLDRNVCKLPVQDASPVDLTEDTVLKHLPSHVQYACRYWVDHLQQAGYLQQVQLGLFDCGKAHTFLQEHFLHWLEALSLMGNMPDGVAMVRTLESMLTVSDSVWLPTSLVG